MNNENSFVKSKGSKKLDDLVVGDVVRNAKTGELHRLEAITLEEDKRSSNATYFYFGSFLVHYQAMKRMFKTASVSENSHKMFMVYERESK